MVNCQVRTERTGSNGVGRVRAVGWSGVGACRHLDRHRQTDSFASRSAATDVFLEGYHSSRQTLAVPGIAAVTDLKNKPTRS